LGYIIIYIIHNDVFINIINDNYINIIYYIIYVLIILLSYITGYIIIHIFIKYSSNHAYINKRYRYIILGLLFIIPDRGADSDQRLLKAHRTRGFYIILYIYNI